MHRFILWFFQRLYHELAWSYDLIAWTVSLGRWQSWGKLILPFIPEGHLLELGFGPGHLNAYLRRQGRFVIGLDESMPMCRYAVRRQITNRTVPMLARGTALAMPLTSRRFDVVFATFPAPFIFQVQTAVEIKRLLKPGGRMVLLLAYQPAGKDLVAIFIRTIFRLTGQQAPTEIEPGTIGVAYNRLGFEVSVTWQPAPNGSVLICQAKLPLENQT